MTAVEVWNFLRCLGRDEAEVADGLRFIGATGWTCSPCYCPVATAIKQYFGTYDVDVNGSDIRVKGTKLAPPYAVARFIRGFDSGEYPDLIRT